MPAVPPPTPVNPIEYQTAANELAAYRDVVGPEDPVVVAGEAALLTTLSTSISPERAHTELAKIDSAVHALHAGVTADEKRITLTSRRADVPLSFENNLEAGARRDGTRAPRQREVALPERRRPDR